MHNSSHDENDGILENGTASPGRPGSSGGQDAFEIRGATCPLASLRLLKPDVGLVADQFTRMPEKRYAMFLGAPLVIDLSDVRYGGPVDLEGLVRLLRDRGFAPVAVVGGGERQTARAQGLGLGAVRSLRTLNDEKPTAPPPEPQRPGRPAPPVRPRVPGEASTMVVTQPVRSGQKVYATERDLVLLGAVSPGAEVLADGNIHAYAPLRGRALAGARGAEDARVYCQRLEAELVSVAGYYLTQEDLPSNLRGKAAMFWLEDGRLLAKSLP